MSFVIKPKNTFELWQGYWFAPAPYLDLAVVRVLAVALQLYLLPGIMNKVVRRASLPEESWEPLIILNVLNSPFGWGYRPPAEALEIIFSVGMAAGVLALIGLLTNLSLAVFAGACVYLAAFKYSFGDLYHPDAIMMIALSVLAASPSGRVLSVDSAIRRYLRPAPRVDRTIGWRARVSLRAGRSS